MQTDVYLKSDIVIAATLRADANAVQPSDGTTSVVVSMQHAHNASDLGVSGANMGASHQRSPVVSISFTDRKPIIVFNFFFTRCTL